MRKLSSTVGPCLLILLLIGCASTSPTSTTSTEPGLPMDPVRIQADPEGVLSGGFWDAHTLFSQAGQLYDEKQYQKAAAVYRQLIDEFPDSDLLPAGRYNLGLCLEALDQCDQAEVYFRLLLDQKPPAFEPGELLFHIGQCAEKVESWAKAADVFGRQTDELTLSPLLSSEAEVRLGIALYHLGRDNEATGHLRTGLTGLTDLLRYNRNLSQFYIGKGYFILGEIYFKRFRAASLNVGESELEKAYNNKADLLLLARAQYVKAIRSHVAHWMTAGLYRIGQGYELFRQASIDAPLPVGLTVEQRPEYKSKLDERLKPALRKAVAAHKRNLRFGAELNYENEWIARSRADLARLTDRQQTD